MHTLIKLFMCTLIESSSVISYDVHDNLLQDEVFVNVHSNKWKTFIFPQRKKTLYMA